MTETTGDAQHQRIFASIRAQNHRQRGARVTPIQETDQGGSNRSCGKRHPT